jgi:hypothetical protein
MTGWKTIDVGSNLKRWFDEESSGDGSRIDPEDGRDLKLEFTGPGGREPSEALRRRWCNFRMDDDTIAT